MSWKRPWLGDHRHFFSIFSIDFLAPLWRKWRLFLAISLSIVFAIMEKIFALDFLVSLSWRRFFAIDFIAILCHNGEFFAVYFFPKFWDSPELGLEVFSVHGLIWFSYNYMAMTCISLSRIPQFLFSMHALDGNIFLSPLCEAEDDLPKFSITTGQGNTFERYVLYSSRG